MRVMSAIQGLAKSWWVVLASASWTALVVVSLSWNLWLMQGSPSARALVERGRIPLVLDHVLVGIVGLAGLWVSYNLLRSAQAALKASERTHRQLVEGLPDIVMRFDREGRHLYVSSNVAQVVDIPAAQFLGKTHRELAFPEEMCRLWEQAIGKVIQSGAPYETEFTIQGNKGLTVFDWRLAPERDARGQIISVLSISRDVTAQRQAEQNYATLFREMLDGFALHEIICDAQGVPVDYRFLAANPAFERLTGLRASDIVGKTVLEVMPNTERRWIDAYGRVALSGEPTSFENYAAALDRTYEVRAFRPAPGQFATVFADITLHKRTEADLRDRQARFHAIFDNAPVALWEEDFSAVKARFDQLRSAGISDFRAYLNAHPEEIAALAASVRILQVNQHSAEVLGAANAEQVGRDLPTYFTPDSLPAFREEMIALAEGQTHFRAEIPILNSRGEPALLDLALSIHPPHQEAMDHVLVSFVDISARRQAEEALRASEERYRNLFGEMVNGFALHDIICDDQGNAVDYVTIEVNAAYESLLGAPCALVLGKKASEMLPPDELAHWLGIFGPVALTGQSARYEMYSPLNAKHFSGAAYSPEKGRFAVTFTDVTSRLHAEEALRASESQYRLIVQAAMDGYWLADMQGRLLEVNAAYCRMSGYTEDELLGMCISDLEAAETLADTAAHMQHLTTLGQVRFETQHRRKDGNVFDVEVSAQYQPVAGMRLVAFLRDITAHKQAEMDLRRANERLSLAQRSAGAGLWDWDMPTGKLDWSPELFHLFGLDPEAAPTFDIWRSAMLAEDRQLAEDRIGAAIRDHAPLSNEYRVVLPTGEVRWINALGNTVYDAQGTPRRMSGICLDITARKQAEDALRASEEQFRTLAALIPAGVYLTDPQGRCEYANPRWCEMAGMAPSEPLGDGWVQGLHPEDRPTVLAAWDQMVASQGRWGLEYRFQSRDGRVTWVHGLAAAQRNVHGEIIRYVGVNQDITERKQAEEERERLRAQLMQSQKMESVGRLAGGVAHDFNNMLGVILGHAELAMQEVDPAQPLHADLEEIRRAAQRSADLTRQLLAFARRQTATPKVLDLNDTVAGMLRMLQRLIGENIDLVWQPGAELGSVKIDPSQVDQILANLCVNARDAIAGVGKITIETHNAALDAAGAARYVEATPGDYVVLVVHDTGSGMGPEVLDHLFEPFFTTKGVGQGTGLGLATVYGIVRQNHGFADVQSALGEGSTFRIYLPRFAAPAVQPTAAALTQAPHGHGETVLIVEDEAAVLRMAEIMLQRLDYKVLTAPSPTAALRLADAQSAEIHLLITDVVMPDMNGRDLAARLREARPALKCVFMSGYTADVIARQGVLDDGVLFMQKPFTMQTLAARVHEALGGPPAS